ncbi:MAG TPA: biotin--[acetyl-CoA-carboxylase] ligase [Acidimicrobiia bacterium]|nr:biotin--[acetyl-CoA-carboxylase] ligase [Acidimicrobiia bacterium]
MPDPTASHARPPGDPRDPGDRGANARLVGTRFSDVRWFAEIDSTNRYLLDEAARGAVEGVVAVADSQSAGRGRLGREWQSPRDAALLASVLLRPALAIEHVPLLVTAAALAAADAVEHLAGIAGRLKWPNDLIVRERKLAGVLAEAIPGQAVVVGMGLNVHWDVVPPELDKIATACNLESDVAVDRVDLLVEWLMRYDARIGALATLDGRERLRADAVARSATLGRRVRVELADRVVEGVATDLTELGHLSVARDDGTIETVVTGDVVHARPT